MSELFLYLRICAAANCMYLGNRLVKVGQWLSGLPFDHGTAPDGEYDPENPTVMDYVAMLNEAWAERLARR